jgi:NADH:ubiquinone oxidoreductase subunit 6 (subunit J)
VDYYGPLIYSKLPEKEVLKLTLTKNPHLQLALGLFEPRLSAKSREAFKEIEHAEGILRSVKNLVDSIQFVVTDLKSNNTADRSQPVRKDYERRIQKLEGLCSERGDNAQRALDALNRQLDYLTKRHSIREAKSIKILTILASLYLPLSLSASVLGMQSPFKQVAHTKTVIDQESGQDLVGTNLLFDFFGVFIGLATVTIFILHAIRLGLWLKSEGLGMISKNFSGPFSIFYYGRRWRFGGRGGRVFELVQGFTAWWIGGGLCITLLVIFMVGMLKGAQSAWNTAWRWFTTYLVVGGVFIGCYAGIYFSLYSKKVRGR